MINDSYGVYSIKQQQEEVQKNFSSYVTILLPSTQIWLSSYWNPLHFAQMLLTKCVYCGDEIAQGTVNKTGSNSTQCKAKLLCVEDKKQESLTEIWLKMGANSVI